MRETIILGANGFVGRSLASRLLARADGGRVVLGSRGPMDLGADGAGERVETLRYDDLRSVDADRLADADVVVDLVSGGRDRFGSEPNMFARVDGHARIVDELVRREWGGHFVFLSSGGTIYGPGSRDPIPETAPLRPVGAYGLEKAMIELHLDTLGRWGALSSLTLRLANVYGPGQAARAGFGIVPTLIRAMGDGTGFTRYGTGKAVRDYVFIDDVVEAIIAATGARATGAFNIGSGEGTSINDLIAQVRDLTGRPLTVKPVANPAGEPEAIVLDPGRAREAFGWTPRVSLREGLRRTLAHHGLIDGCDTASEALAG